jgi:preprotein translocase subunit YajC
LTQEYLQFLPFVLILGIFYVIVVLPQQRRQRKLQDMIDSLKKGDRIITSGGIYGTVVGVKDDRIEVRVAENVKVEMSRNAVTALQNPGEDKE